MLGAAAAGVTPAIEGVTGLVEDVAGGGAGAGEGAPPADEGSAAPSATEGAPAPDAYQEQTDAPRSEPSGARHDAQSGALEVEAPHKQRRSGRHTARYRNRSAAVAPSGSDSEAPSDRAVDDPTAGLLP